MLHDVAINVLVIDSKNRSDDYHIQHEYDSVQAFKAFRADIHNTDFDSELNFESILNEWRNEARIIKVTR